MENVEETTEVCISICLLYLDICFSKFNSDCKPCFGWIGIFDAILRPCHDMTPFFNSRYLHRPKTGNKRLANNSPNLVISTYNAGTVKKVHKNAGSKIYLLQRKRSEAMRQRHGLIMRL